ncbi:hypothetical protein [uncultured Tenacibaculum sp.]|uniref:hypothetical protein n=1 Tax=uncultured Tenacibaculum sp. TaxID=174713 RepID=UPI002635A257|nr:hypothetical protein [uncultured Tenacibaculum sp.]
MININSIAIPTFDWVEKEKNANLLEWSSKDRTKILSVNFFNIPPDLPTIQNVHILRKMYGEMLRNNNGGIVSLDIVELSGFKAVKIIMKFPQNPGMAYLSSYTIPFRDYSFVVKIQASESGVSGMRDTVIFNKLLANGEVKVVDKNIENWFYDPYDATISDGIRMNKSEEEKYDEEFPEHPLSISRKLFRQIEKEIKFEKELYDVAKFER